MSKLNFIKLNIQRFAVQDDNTILKKADLKAYHEEIAPFLGGNFMMSTNISDYYSTDEKVVGIWVDGRPIYQKVITVDWNDYTRISDYHKSLDMTSYHIKDPIDVRLLFHTSVWWIDSSTKVTGDSGSTDTTSAVSIRFDKDIIHIFKGSAITIDNTVLILQYTKTTDTATSALTTPGAYDINFPNTWPANKEIFFGNGLYGYRATGNFSATTTGSEFHRDMPVIPTTSRLINSGGNFTVGGYSDFNVGLGPTYSSTQLVISSCLFLNNGGIPRFRVMTFQYGLTTSDTYDIWFTYTK